MRLATIAAAAVSAVAMMMASGRARAEAPTTAPAGGKAVLPNTVVDGGRTLLPNGWRVTPAGKVVELPGDSPTRAVVTPDGKWVITATGGHNEHGVSVTNAATGELVDHAKVRQTFVGLAVDRAGKTVYLSGGRPVYPKGAGAAVHRFTLGADGKLTAAGKVNVEKVDLLKAFITGVAVGADGSLFVADVDQEAVYKVNPETGKLLGAAKVGPRPGQVVASPDGKTVVVANWAGGSVTFLDAATMKVRATVATGAHPADVLFAPDGRVFVANAATNFVSVIDHLKEGSPRVTETIRTSLDPKSPVGSTPIALAMAGDKLFVANADNNDVAVVDVDDRGEAVVQGFIPTWWYPSALAASAEGKKLYVGTAQGIYGPNATPHVHIANMRTGHLATVDIPDKDRLHDYTKQVIANTPTGVGMPGEAAVDPARRAALEGTFKKIKYVLYVIKENRTYDQVFGDVKAGNGDPGLAMFGEKITPNQHELARQWVLLDNLYCNGDVSKDGHFWCDAAYATDFLQKFWVNTYSKRGAPRTDERLTRPPGGFIWDAVMAKGMGFRTYGERDRFVANSSEEAPEEDATVRGGEKNYVSDAWRAAKGAGGGGARDYEKADIFIKDLKQAEQTGKWPRLITMSLPENHTRGMLAGWHTPEACVASNDLAVGKIVEAVTHSKFWPQTAIFIIEDDAQNGSDHVDAHRTAGLVISPYTRRHVVDSTMYSTASMVRTMGLMLGVGPLSQYDAAATPMINSFQETADLTPFTAVKPQTDLMARNPVKGPGAKESAELDWSDDDVADAEVFNHILWDHFKPGTEMPAPVHGMIVVR